MMPVQVRGQQTIAHQVDRNHGRVEEELHRTGIRIARDHLVLFQTVHADAVLAIGPEVTRGQQVSLRPVSVFRVVREKLPRRERVTEVGPGRVGRLRDRDAVVVDGTARGELAEQPAVGEVIVEHDRVARKVRAVINRKPCPQIAELRWPGQQVA